MKMQYVMELDRLDVDEARLLHRDANEHSQASLDMDRRDWEGLDGGRRYIVTIEPIEIAIQEGTL
jgi:hypothetical protein